VTINQLIIDFCKMMMPVISVISGKRCAKEWAISE